MTILRTENLSKRFGGVTAVDDLSLEIEKGIIAGLIGPNGAGKTTLFNLLTGFHKPDSGKIIFNEEEITKKSTHYIAKKGLVRTFQIMRPLSRMTVLENLMLAAKKQSGEFLPNQVLNPSKIEEEEDSIRKRAIEILELLGLGEKTNEYAGSLSGGQRRLLELARTLMASPRILLLDEPTGGVNPSLARDILNHLKYLNDRGLTIFMTEHNVRTIMSLSDVVYVMANGKKIAQGSPEDIRHNKEVIDAYLGG